MILKLVVGAITEGLAVVMLAATQSVGSGFSHTEFNRGEIRTLVATIAEWLVATFSTTAPEIILIFFEIGHVRSFLGDNRI